MKRILSTMLSIAFMFINIVPINAASAKCTISGSTTVTIGSTVTVSVRISGKSMYTIKGSISSSNNNVLSGSGSVYRKADLQDPQEAKGISTVSKQVSFKANSVGQSTITFSPDSSNCIDVNDNAISISGGSLTIKVVQKNQNNTPNTPNNSPTSSPDNLSKENTLSSLSVSEGTLSPTFDASVTKYTVNLDADKTKVNITAKAKDSKASVSGIGEKTLKVGKNTFVIKCTSENGSTRDYTVEINVNEKPLVYVNYSNEKLGVVRDLTDMKVPNGFEKSTTKIDGQDVDAWTNEKLNMLLCYLINEKGEKSFYVVEDGKVLYQFKKVQIDSRDFYVIPLEDKMKNRDGFVFEKVKIAEDIELDGWTYKNQTMKSYFQVYLMNEAGEKHIYDYERTEGQLQIYTEFTTSHSGIDIFMITTIVFALTSFGLLFLYLNFKKKSISTIKEYYQKKGQ